MEGVRSLSGKQLQGLTVRGRDHGQPVEAFRHPAHGRDGIVGFRHQGGRTIEIACGVTQAGFRSTHHNRERPLKRQQGTHHLTPHAHQRRRWKDAAVADKDTAQNDRLAARPEEAVERAGFRLGRGDLVDEFDAAQDEIENTVIDSVDLSAQAGEGVFGRSQRDASDDVMNQG